MKTLQTIIWSLSIGSFIIGIHQSITFGMIESYWIFMFGLLPLLVLSIWKKQKASKIDATQKKK